MTQEIKTIRRLERLSSSFNGNPRYRVIFTDGDHRDTEPDASIAYGIANPEFQGVPVRITLNRRGHITHAEPITGRQGND